jgi:hypothetical protein
MLLHIRGYWFLAPTELSAGLYSKVGGRPAGRTRSGDSSKKTAQTTKLLITLMHRSITTGPTTPA